MPVEIGSKWVCLHHVTHYGANTVFKISHTGTIASGEKVYCLSPRDEWFTEDALQEMFVELFIDEHTFWQRFVRRIRPKSGNLKSQEPIPGVPQPFKDNYTLQWFIDGDQIAIVNDDFEDLQASPAVFLPRDTTAGKFIEQTGSIAGSFDKETWTRLRGLLVVNGGHLYQEETNDDNV